jgi:hypothetical protein
MEARGAVCPPQVAEALARAGGWGSGRGPLSRRGWILRLCSGHEKRKRRRPGFDWRQSPGPSSAQRLCRRFAAPLCLPWRLLSSAWGGALGALGEPTYRLYNCQRCGVQVRICHRCDHGNIYCSAECSRIRRRESLRRAQARYQRSRRGAGRHAARQRAWRARRVQTVTHQGCARGAACGSVSDHPITMSQPADANHPATTLGTVQMAQRLTRCSFCGTSLPLWARVYPVHWGG